MEPLPIARIILYVRDIPKVAAFYQKHFGLTPLSGAEDGWLEMHDAEFQAGRLSLGPELTHVLDPENNLDLRSALLGSGGAMERDGAGSVR
jgi:catechol 2,3-dioxygenase-like lactoylglutathione lyase family enzyme